jgi:hypothetical protein
MNATPFNRRPIKLHHQTINGINVYDLYIRLSSEVVCKGWIYGENREAIFFKCNSASYALKIPAMGCMVMEETDRCGAFEFSKQCETVEEALEFMEYVNRVLL